VSTAQHTLGALAFESEGSHYRTTSRATTENSGLLRNLERRKIERAAMRAALVQADQFTAIVERFMRADLPGDVQPATETEVAEAMYALRAAIAKATGSAA
jgi:hypothetical protein